jgi:hypothetical protein
MPKNLTAAMRAHLDAETTRLAAIWRITRRVRGLAIERVEHRAEVELQAALGAKLPAPVLLFQALSDELARFQADQAPTVEKYPLLASLVGKRGAVDLQRAAQLVAEQRARWLQRGPPSRRSGYPGGSRGCQQPGGDRRRA